MKLQRFNGNVVKLFIHRRGVFDGTRDNGKTEYLKLPIAIAGPNGRENGKTKYLKSPITIAGLKGRGIVD